MASLLSTIVAAIDREYDRRIRRASLITEYGAAHHAHHEEAHGGAGTYEEEGDVAIANVPRGTDVAAEHADAASPAARARAGETAVSELELDPLPAAPSTSPGAAVAPADDEVEIINARPGTPVDPGQ